MKLINFYIGFSLLFIVTLFYSCNNDSDIRPDDVAAEDAFILPLHKMGANMEEVLVYEKERHASLSRMENSLSFISANKDSIIQYLFDNDSLFCVSLLLQKNERQNRIIESILNNLDFVEEKDGCELYIDNLQSTLTVIREEIETWSVVWIAIESPEVYEESYKGSLGGHEYVDLGLSVKWATCNLGASSPTKYGDYYQWGEKSPSYSFWWSDYKYWNDKNGDGYFWDDELSYLPTDISGSTYDAARYEWGHTWRMPTKNEWQELIDNCTFSIETDGLRVLGPSGLDIILPFAGYKYQNKEYSIGSIAYYWSSVSRQSSHAYCFGAQRNRRISDFALFTGMPIRPVTN
ncbi:MAG: hypothetical protein IJQ05_03185 [Bacteroidaceae bacterium]|nr:hypothetical protein [Bacteroidaceae bacterium]